MSVKGDGAVRVGCGLYDWHFTPDPSCRVRRLVISIDRMRVLPASAMPDVMEWLSGLLYPWCTPEEALRVVPRIDDLEEVLACLAALPSGAPA